MGKGGLETKIFPRWQNKSAGRVINDLNLGIKGLEIDFVKGF